MKLLLLSALFSPWIAISAFAGSATWNLDPANGDWNMAANWTPETVPNGPGDVATFDQSDSTAVTLSQSVKVDSIIFAAGGSAFTISTGLKTLTISGAGVINNSQLPQNFTVAATPGFIQFINSANAGDATYTQTGESGGSTIIYFLENASAGNATFINQGGDFSAGGVLFYGSSTAATGTFFNRPGTANGGATDFFENSNAGNATIVCDGGSPEAGVQAFCYFNDSSSAANATFTVNGASVATGSPAFITFYSNSTAANATLTLNGGTVPGALGGRVLFGYSGGAATAADSTLVANGGTNGGAGGLIVFYDDAIGERARVEVFGNGRLNITRRNPPGVGVGSIEGDGGILLGANNLTVGANDKDTTFSGVIADGSHFSGGSLTKVGFGRLTLTNANTYSGGTVLDSEDGLLLINNRGSHAGSGTGSGPVTVIQGALGGVGTVTGPVTIGTGSGAGANLVPGPGPARTGRFAISNSLSLNSPSTYVWKLDAVNGKGGTVVAAGVTINGTLFLPVEIQFATLNAGIVLTVIDNTSADPIAGTFTNLPDGSTLTVGSNKFRVNYEGGDGNDLTLTVVP